MAIYKIADLYLEMNPRFDKLRRQAEKYRVQEAPRIDFEIFQPYDYLEEKQLESPQLTLEDCEYMWFGADFSNKMLEFNGAMIHASCVSLDNEAYLFSANSGVGKSTHTALWVKYFGADRAFIINDDKPIIRRIGNEFFAYGTPFSGKTDLNENVKVKLKAIVFLERGLSNSISTIPSSEIIERILNQTFRPRVTRRYITFLSLLDLLIKEKPIFKLNCNISFDAVKLVYDTINNYYSNS